MVGSRPVGDGTEAVAVEEAPDMEAVVEVDRDRGQREQRPLVVVPASVLVATTVVARAHRRRRLRTPRMKMESSTPAGAVVHSGTC